MAVLKNGLEYPMLWRFWVKTGQENEKETKIDLAKQMFKGFRQINNARLWVAMDRWFLCKRFLVWLVKHNFDWVPRPSGTLSCSGKSTTPGNKKKSTLS
jgi:hypothetical protein